MPNGVGVGVGVGVGDGDGDGEGIGAQYPHVLSLFPRQQSGKGQEIIFPVIFQSSPQIQSSKNPVNKFSST